LCFVDDDQILARAGSRGRARKKFVLLASKKPGMAVGGESAGGPFSNGVIGGGTAGET
jgi:hypothetical protein